MKLKVYSSDGVKAQEKDFALKEFEGKKGIQALRDAIVAYQASARQGTSKAKNFGEVKGTGKKPWRQKGTGNARHGSRRSPLWVKGAVVFGPRPRDWSVTINQKVRQLAFQRALFDKAVEGGLSLIEKIAPAKPKTKAITQVLERIHPEGKVLLVDENFEKNAHLAARNIERVSMVNAATVNAWDIVRSDRVLISEQGFAQVLARAND
ncbi:MAG TPA: 50S ribosomal protein L4 [Opitutales bacterium]|nr:50S ribosomal protein L4 [Opitutales bacterium]